jgi:hypothetical protein
MKPWLVWVIGIVLLAAAWGVQQITPDDDDAVVPFTVPAAVGEKAVGRTFEITVTDVRLGDRASAPRWAADGTWLVVDVEAQARFEESGSILDQAFLQVDGVTYRASERPTSIFREGLTTGIPRVGSLAFDLPDEVASRTGILRLGLGDEPRLDSLMEVPIDLGALARQDEVELLRTGWAPR